MNTMKYLEPLHNTEQLAHVKGGLWAVSHIGSKVIFTFQVDNPEAEELLQDIVLENNTNENSLKTYITRPYAVGNADAEV